MQPARAYDRRRGKTAARGYDGTWRKLRLMVLREQPLCACGRVATEVDHIIPIAKAPELRLEMSNLQAMCKSCHSRKTNAEDGGGFGGTKESCT